MTQVPGNQHAEDLLRCCDARQERVAELTEKISAGERKNQMRTVDELTPEALARAIAAYEKAHNTKPDFGFAPDRAWMEGYSAHAASQDAEEAARSRYLKSIAVQTADPLGPIFRIDIRRIDQDGVWSNVSSTIDAHRRKGAQAMIEEHQIVPMADTTPAPIGEGALREALWICVEHNALHFGETHNTVVQGRAALAGAARPERVPLTEAARDVLTERQRQISVEGWTPEHDDKGRLPDELALAAASYVCADEQNAPPAIWPWDWSWWKPSDRRRNLVKSGALILAEIERLDRAAARAAKEGGA